MKLKLLLADEIRNKSIAPYLPSSYQQLGDICLIKLSKPARKYKKTIGQSILKSFSHFRAVCLQDRISGELRQPKVEVIAGEGNTETLHTEFGYKFRLDVSKIMWSKGNHCERKRLISEMRAIKPKPVIIDMFAGIGYWAIPIAKFAEKIYAIDKNKASISYLQKNIRLNRITNIIPICSDCRAVTLGERADVVLMGYFPNTIRFLQKAMELAKAGALVYYHDLAPDESVLRAKLSNYKILQTRKVKEFAPGIYHYVALLRK